MKKEGKKEEKKDEPATNEPTEKKPVEKVEEKVAEKTEEKKPKKSDAPKGKFYYAVGRRKAATAQVRIYSVDEEMQDVDIVINEKPLETFVVREDLRTTLIEPLRLSGLEKNMRITIHVRGGGMRGQVEAARLAIARALVRFDENLKGVLKSAKMLTRDARVVERKKPGLRKARRSPQWSKR